MPSRYAKYPKRSCDCQPLLSDCNRDLLNNVERYLPFQGRNAARAILTTDANQRDCAEAERVKQAIHNACPPPPDCHNVENSSCEKKRSDPLNDMVCAINQMQQLRCAMQSGNPMEMMTQLMQSRSTLTNGQGAGMSSMLPLLMMFEKNKVK